ncbi:hypothetical protein KZZ52_03085 [Dactylosporangium sp. AC04546]|uniref:hypothetical protein n=1 Tax=Dactylosporangium sp. AC04546 TaxID=2862460 RepID=UPI001EDFF261|nr:hypothetical protein [Dactylosporangium sp. AC04546]WVK84437.1 hypothetical protein KZZ52_03085 [Dactylosporangium sp. AC04546]
MVVIIQRQPGARSQTLPRGQRGDVVHRAGTARLGGSQRLGRGMVGLAGSMGFDPSGRLLGGASQTAVDDHLGVGHVDGDGLARVDAAEGDLLSGDHDDAGVGGVALNVHRAGRGLWWRTGGAGRAQPPDLGRGQRVSAGAQQFARVGVEEHQRLPVEADAHPAPGEDLGCQHHMPAQGDVAGGVDGPVDLDRGNTRLTSLCEDSVHALDPSLIGSA